MRTSGRNWRKGSTTCNTSESKNGANVSGDESSNGRFETAFERRNSFVGSIKDHSHDELDRKPDLFVMEALYFVSGWQYRSVRKARLSGSLCTKT